MKLKHAHKKAFTLIEILIVLGFLAIFAGVAGLNLVGYRNQHGFDLEMEEMLAVIRSMQSNAITQESGQPYWGVRFNNVEGKGDYYDAFWGQAYDPANVVTHRVLRQNVEFIDPVEGDFTDVIFKPLTGAPIIENTTKVALRGAKKIPLTAQWVQTSDENSAPCNFTSGCSGFDTDGNQKNDTAIVNTGSAARIELIPGITSGMYSSAVYDSEKVSDYTNLIWTTSVPGGAKSWTESTDNDFNDNTHESTTVTGTGEEASTILGIVPDFDDGDGSDGACTDATFVDTDTKAIYNCTTVDITGTVTITGSQPLVIKAKSNITISGTLDLSGANSSGNTGGSGGGGGGKEGGDGGTFSSDDGKSGVTGGDGGGGGGYGNCCNNSNSSGGGGGGGNATNGGSGGDGSVFAGSGGAAGIEIGDSQISSFTQAAVGGSGGGGGGARYTSQGAGGGGGGGAVKISTKSTITVSGTITTNGGNGYNGGTYRGGGGAGAGGTIWLQGDILDLGGTVTAVGGTGGSGGGTGAGTGGASGGGDGTDNAVANSSGGGGGGGGSHGRIRLDYGRLLGTTSPPPGYQRCPFGCDESFPQFKTTGVSTAAIKEMGAGTRFTTIGWTTSGTSGTEIINIEMQSCNTSDCSDRGPNDWSAVTNGHNFQTSPVAYVDDAHGFVRYRALFSSDGTTTPFLENITITHEAVAIDVRAGTSPTPDCPGACTDWTDWQEYVGYDVSSSAAPPSEVDNKQYIQYRLRLARADINEEVRIDEIEFQYDYMEVSGDEVRFITILPNGAITN